MTKRGNELANEINFRSTMEIYSHSPVTGVLIIMSMQTGPLGGCTEKMVKRLSVGSNLSANVERPPPRELVRPIKVSAGFAAIGLESLG